MPGSVLLQRHRNIAEARPARSGTSRLSAKKKKRQKPRLSVRKSSRGRRRKIRCLTQSRNFMLAS